MMCRASIWLVLHVLLYKSLPQARLQGHAATAATPYPNSAGLERICPRYAYKMPASARLHRAPVALRRQRGQAAAVLL